MQPEKEDLFVLWDKEERSAPLHHVRAFAVLMVLVAHAFHNFSRGAFPKEAGTWIHSGNPIYCILAEGHAGVSLFLVLSGFLFTTLTYQKPLNYWGFIRNRVLRIYPMYTLMVLCGAYTFSSTLTTGNFLGSLLLLQGTPAAHDGGVFTLILWTISTEFIFYLIFPFLINFVNRYGVRIIFCWLAVFGILRTLSVLLGASPRDMPYFTIVGRIDQFLCGMIAAVYVKNAPGHERWWRVSLIPIVLLIGGVLLWFNMAGGWERVCIWKSHWLTLEGGLCALFIVAYRSLGQSPRDYPQIYNKALTYVAAISYSLYLWHFPVYEVYTRHALARLLDDVLNNALANAALVLPIVFAISTLTYLCIERPFLRLRKDYVRKT